MLADGSPAPVCRLPQYCGRDLLLAKQQQAVLFQGGTYRMICAITAGHVDQAGAPHFDSEFGSEGNQFHDATPMEDQIWFIVNHESSGG